MGSLRQPMWILLPLGRILGADTGQAEHRDRRIAGSLGRRPVASHGTGTIARYSPTNEGEACYLGGRCLPVCHAPNLVGVAVLCPL
jgi:hypothetical protein